MTEKDETFENKEESLLNEETVEEAVQQISEEVQQEGEEEQKVFQEAIEELNREEEPEVKTRAFTENDIKAIAEEVVAKEKKEEKPVKEKKRHSFVWLWVLLTVALCAASGYFCSKIALDKYIEATAKDPDEGRTVIYQGVSSDNKYTVVDDLSAVVEKIEDSVVEIYTEIVAYNRFYGNYVTSGAGSGVILTKDGYIVTNNHVIEGAKKISVTLHNGQTYTAVLVGRDEQNDLAVIKIEAENLPVAVLGSSENLKAGQTVIAIGNPLGTLGGTVTDGIVSATSREVTIEGQTMTLLQTNTTINPGNSGGGLFNASGELVGIVNAKYSATDVEGIGFAIPIDIAKTVVENIIENGSSERPYIGISCTSIDTEAAMQYYGLSSFGVYVNDVTLESTRQAGLQAGDLIIALDSDKVQSFTDLQSALEKHKAGDSVNLRIVRNGEVMYIRLVLAANPNG